MPFHVGTDLQLHQNQLLGARLEALPGLPSAPRQGRIFYVSGALTGYDGVSFTGRPGMAIVAGATTLAQYRLWGGLNQSETVTGLWTFAPSQTGSTTVGLLTLPPAPGVPQVIGGYKPFSVSGQSRIYTGFGVNPDTDGAGDLTQPSAGLKRYVPNWTQHLHADLLDGYHATLGVTAYGIPVRVDGGHLRVPLDPLQVDHAPSRQYVDRRRARVRIRTSVNLRTVAALPAYTFNGAAVYTANSPGALVVDGAAVVVDQRIMVANEADATRNWIMKVTATGSAGAPWSMRYVADVAGNGDVDPDGLGPYDYGDLFQVLGGTQIGTTWVMSGSPTAGGGGQPPPGEEVFFVQMQSAATVTAGRGITVVSGKVHLWKSTYAVGELNTFPYLSADVDGAAALGVMGMYGVVGAYLRKSATVNRIPKRASDVGAVFQDAGVADDGVSFFPDVARTSGMAAKPWAELWAIPGTLSGTPGRFTHVYGAVGTTQLMARSWANFIGDLTTDLGLGNYALKATTITINGNSGIVVTGGTQSLASDRLWTVTLGVIPPGSVGLPPNSVGYGNASGQLVGNASLFFFNESYAAISSKMNLGAVTAPVHRLEFAPGTTTVAPIRFTSPSAILTVPAAGVFETDLTPAIKRARLYYTDGVPLRHALMYTDDVNLTNDPVARPNGGVGFYGDTGSNFLIAKLDGQVIGTGDFAVLVRFLYPASTASQTNYGVFSITSDIVGGAGPYDLSAYMTGTPGVPELRVLVRTETGAIGGANWVISDMSRVAGKVIDLLVSRIAGVVTIYIDGVNTTPAPTNASYQASPIANSAATLRFHLGAMHTAVPMAHTDFYRAALFNRGFATEDEAKFLSRYGIAAADLWGSTVDLLAGAGGFETMTGWTATQPAGGVAGLTTTPANVYRGTSAAVIATPADGSFAALTHTTQGTPGKRLRYEFKAKRDAISADPTSVQCSYGGVGFTKVVPISTGTTYGTYATEGVWEVPATGVSFARTAGQVNKTFYIDDAAVRQVGALMDLDLGVGRGTVVPDRSSRYPAVLNGVHWVHLVPSPVGSGDGTYTGIQKVQKTITAKDNDLKDVVHNLGTTGVSVDVWDSQNRHVGVSVTRKAGNEANAVTLGFNVFGSPSVEQTFMVVITG